MDPKVTIIILNWKGWNDTLECLESVYQIFYSNYEIIVVDNNSEDESIEQIRAYCKGKIIPESNFYEYKSDNKPIKLFEFNEKEINFINDKNNEFFSLAPNKKLILIKNEDNYGFAEGNNIAIRYALQKTDTDYVLILNNDTIVDKEFLNELVKVAESSSDIGAVGPKTYFYDNKNIIQWIGGGILKPEYFKVQTLGSFEVDKGQYDNNIKIDYISGSCMLCKRKVVEKIDLMDPSYFMYFEDGDWCLRMLKAGYKCSYAFKSKIWHKMGKSSTNCFKTYYYHRNRVYVAKKNLKRTEYYKALIKFIFLTVPKESMEIVAANGLKFYFKCFLRGIVFGIFKRVD